MVESSASDWVVPNDFSNGKLIPVVQCKILGIRNQRGKDSGTESCETDTRACISLLCLNPLTEGQRAVWDPEFVLLKPLSSCLSSKRGISLSSSHDMSRTAPKTIFHQEVRPRVQSAGTEREHRLKQTKMMQTVNSTFGVQLQRKQRGTSGVTHPPNAAEILLKAWAVWSRLSCLLF